MALCLDISSKVGPQARYKNIFGFKLGDGLGFALYSIFVIILDDTFCSWGLSPCTTKTKLKTFKLKLLIFLEYF